MNDSQNKHGITHIMEENVLVAELTRLYRIAVGVLDEYTFHFCMERCNLCYFYYSLYGKCVNCPCAELVNFFELPHTPEELIVVPCIKITCSEAHEDVHVNELKWPNNKLALFWFLNLLSVARKRCKNIDNRLKKLKVL